MENKKIFLALFLGIFLLLSLSSVSATLKSYDLKENKITLKNNFLFIPTSTIREDTLKFNSYGCLTNCSAEGTTVLYEDNKLFDGINLKNHKGILENKNYHFYIKKEKIIKIDVPIYEDSCNTINFKNGSSGESCSSQLKETIKEDQNVSYWEEYTGQTLSPGVYEWRLEGTKKINENIDWVVNSNEKDYKEWAWWNSSYSSCRTFQLLNASSGTRDNQPLIINLTGLDGKLENNYDVRIVNKSCSDDGSEISRTVVDSASNYATVAITFSGDLPANYSVYYENSSIVSAPTNESKLTFFDEFNDGSLDTDKWGKGSSCSLTESGGLLNTSFAYNNPGCTGQNTLYTLRDFTSEYTYQTKLYDFGDINTIYVSQSSSGTDKGGQLGHVYTGGQALELYAYNGATEIFSPIGGSNVIEFTEWWTNVSGTSASLYKNNIFNYSKSNAYYSGTRIFVLDYTTDTGTHRVSYDYFRVWNNSVNLYEDVPTITVYAVEGTTPIIVLNSPENYFNSSNQTIDFNISISSISAIENVSLYVDEILNQTNSSGFSGDYFFNADLGNGDHTWFINACNLAGCINSSTRNLTIDSVNPAILISSPSGTYTYLYEGYNLTLNFTATDTHLDSCVWEYNGINSSIPCTTGSEEISYFDYSSDVNNGTIFINDTFGNGNSSFVSWNYKILEINKTYNNETIEGSYEDFELFLKKGSGINVNQVVLNYNGTNDTSSVFSSGSQVQAISELLIPSVSADTNNTFYFTVTLSDSTVFNTTNATQLVRNVALDDCSSQPYLFLTLNLVDEENQSAISGDIQVYLGIVNPTNFEEILNFNSSYSGVSSKTFCSNIELNESSFLLGAEIRYDSGNHSAEFYNIQRSELSNYPKQYILYDLKDDETTKFKLLYRGENLIGVEGAIIQLQRKYISEGVYKIVEAPLTSSDSTAVVHIDTNTQNYKATVVKNGELLNTFDNLVFVCQSELTGECTLDLQEFLIPPNSVSIETLQDFSYSISSNIDNKTITLDYTVPTGTTSSINVLATQTDIVGESTICNTTISSAGGSIECGYNQSIQDSYISYNIYKDGVQLAQKSYIVKDDLRDDFGGDNYFILIIFAISLIFMAILSPEWIILNSIISIIVGGATWLIRGMDFVLGLGAIAWLLLAGIIIIIKISQKEDQ
jgi:hypothetical protein